MGVGTSHMLHSSLYTNVRCNVQYLGRVYVQCGGFGKSGLLEKLSSHCICESIPHREFPRAVYPIEISLIRLASSVCRAGYPDVCVHEYVRDLSIYIPYCTYTALLYTVHSTRDTR